MCSLPFPIYSFPIQFDLPEISISISVDLLRFGHGLERVSKAGAIVGLRLCAIQQIADTKEDCHPLAYMSNGRHYKTKQEPTRIFTLASSSLLDQRTERERINVHASASLDKSSRRIR